MVTSTNISGEILVQQGIAEDSATIARRQLEAEAKEQLDRLTTDSPIIYNLEAVFPFQLFPDKIVIEKDRITIIHRSFAWKNVFPILLDNLNGVNVTRGLLFASMTLEISGFERNPEPIVYLRPGEAAKAKAYIMGLLHAHKKGIDVVAIPPDELRDRLEQIGSTRSDIDTLPFK